MSELWARMDETGTWPAELKSYAVEGWQRLPASTSVDAAVQMMRVGGDWVLRPRINPPLVGPGPDGGLRVAFGALPAGASVRVIDTASGEVLGLLALHPVEFVLTDAGIYAVEALLPLPFMPFEMRVAVE